MDTKEEEKESLKDEMRNLIEEARMVILGVQPLFCFQTMAVFNNRFTDLPESGRWAYLTALAPLTLAVALLMTPTAYHRLAERGQVSRTMINLSSNLITVGMVPLRFPFALDVYVVIVAAVGSTLLGWYGASATRCTSALLRFLFPIRKKIKFKRATINRDRSSYNNFSKFLIGVMNPKELFSIGPVICGQRSGAMPILAKITQSEM
jgi:Family of unknown function (DUF6328)